MRRRYYNRTEPLGKWKGMKFIAQVKEMHRFRMTVFSQEKDEGVSICHYLEK